MNRFEVVKDEFRQYPAVDIKIPCHKTKQSAGADFCTPVGFSILPGEQQIIPTDVKCNLLEGEVLYMYIRSSVGIKKGLMLCNNVGVIDTDYYSNPDNDGNIHLALINMSDRRVDFEAGERIAQGVIMNYVSCGETQGNERVGGIGSTGQSS